MAATYAYDRHWLWSTANIHDVHFLEGYPHSSFHCAGTRQGHRTNASENRKRDSQGAITHRIRASTQCSECDEEVEIAGRARLGQKIICGHCGAALEVVATDPLEVEPAQEEDDLWDDDDLDEEELNDLEDDEDDDTDELDDFDDLDDELEIEDDFDDDDFEDDLDDFDDDSEEVDDERWR
jgi:lysine biosynthesis protein LysW